MSSQSPLVSTIIPVYNAEKFLTKTVESVLAQSYSNIELLVVNDGSTDRSGEIARSFGDQIKYIEKPNGGVSSARNLGVGESKGDLIAFLDADDLWAPNKIEKQVAKFIELNLPALILSGVMFIDEYGKRISDSLAPDQKELIENILLLRPNTGYFASTGVLPRSLFRDVGGFDENLSTSADADFLCRASVAYEIFSVGEPVAMYRRHGNQMHHNLAALEHDMNIIYEKVFTSENLPKNIASLRSRAHASLASTLAVGFLSKGKWQDGLSHLVEAFKYDVATPLEMFKRIIAAKL
jgi:glycosyltransferase involved in cell wall biosynthesis